MIALLQSTRYLLLLIFLWTISTSHGFSSSSSSSSSSTTRAVGRTMTGSRTTTTQLHVIDATSLLVDVPQQLETISSTTTLLSSIGTFYQTQPYLAAFLTTSTKASAADWVAQSQLQEEAPNKARRNFAFWLYGGFYQGCFQAFMFAQVFPVWFPDPSATTVLSQVALDLLVMGPMMAMPTVYTIKELMLAGDDDTNNNNDSDTTVDVFAGIRKYVDHVQTKGLLLKYWAIWGPVQTINFALVPPHLRVFFVAAVSFFWTCLLSSVSSSSEEEEQQQGAEGMEATQAQTTTVQGVTNYYYQYPSIPHLQAQTVPIRVLTAAAEEQLLARVSPL